MTVDVLGTKYTITIKKYDEDEVFNKKSIIGYCDDLSKEIVYADAKTFPGWENETERNIEVCNKETLRHEIVHAFFHESGLKDSSNKWEGAWAKNEEMIDWIAIQFPKLLKAFQETGSI